ncbi:hypothetical protein [Streptomyces lasalocidi]|uniref:CGNR zinc finger domain-containing protein n=1 Tax=Streptomyces lasalocidi TaxID=324833 RepID=A0A4U5W7L2_STRLS|nr:hypothetical protein [Streptomyces lasalocidi]TKS96125.1 hypothetical protein E4U91_35735 [Streptomyces lasalocidi]
MEEAAQNTVPLGAWLNARRPFQQMRSALLDAEAYLNGYKNTDKVGAWHRLRDSAGDESAVLAALNALLAADAAVMALDRQDTQWALVACGTLPYRESAAVLAIMALVKHGGARLKGCQRAECGHVFLDWTNGATRLNCRFHAARPLGGVG